MVIGEFYLQHVIDMDCELSVDLEFSIVVKFIYTHTQKKKAPLISWTGSGELLLL